MPIKPISFNPLPFTSSGHFQTILGCFNGKTESVHSDYTIVDLPDGDKIRCEISTPPDWKKTDPTVVFVHGLAGSHRSAYLLRLTPRILDIGYRCVRVNLRGAGSGEHLAKRTYHGGVSQDVYEVVKTIKKTTPLSPLTLIGFSLGGNIILKMLGELGSEAEKYVDNSLTICPAVDLYSSVVRMSHPSNRFYEQYFVYLLKQQVKRRQKLIKGAPKIELPNTLTLYDFDQNYTSQVWNFRGAHDYYKKCSSKYFIEGITTPCHVIFSEDDPVIDPQSIHNAPWPKHVNLWQTSKGGHLGFFGYVGEGYGFRWMDYQIIKFLCDSK